MSSYNLINSIQNTQNSTNQNTNLDKFDLDKLNNLLSSASQALTCGVGTECYNSKQQTTLSNDVLLAQENLRNAPKKLEEAEKNYYLYTQGTSGYEEYKNLTINNEVEKNTDNLKTLFQKKIDYLNELILVLTPLVIYKNYINDTYKNYKKDNKKISKEVNVKKTDNYTNDRRVYYEKQYYNSLLNYYKLFSWIYAICFITLLFFIFYLKTSFSLYFKLFILFIFILYPLLVNKVLILFLHNIFYPIEKKLHSY